MGKTYVVFTGLLVIVGAVGIRYAIKTLRAVEKQGAVMGEQRQVMQDQLRAMEDQISEISVQSGILQQSVAVSRDAAEAAKDSVTHLKNSERPWIFLTPDDTFDLMPGKSKLDWLIWNGGKTVATIVQVAVKTGKYHIRHRPLPALPDYGRSVEFFDVPLPPTGKEKVFSLIDAGNDRVDGLTDKDLMDLSSGWDLVAYGYVQYRDHSGDLHEGRFCYYYARPWRGFRLNHMAPSEYHKCT